MAKGYVIAQINVTDPGTYSRHLDVHAPSLTPTDGRTTAHGGQAKSWDREPHGDHHVMIEFSRSKAATSAKITVEGIL